MQFAMRAKILLGRVLILVGEEEQDAHTHQGGGAAGLEEGYRRM
jgi:hypothetical protein